MDGLRIRWMLLVAACGGELSTGAQPEPAKAEATQVKAEPTPVAEPAKQAAVGDGFEAVVRVDDKPGGKKFQGVWLELANGERWVVTYRPEPWLRSFEGRTVRVTGEVYRPEGQAIMATHFRIATLTVVGGRGPLLAVGPEQTLTGRFKRETVGPGQKNEGDTYWTFVVGDARHLVEAAPEGIQDGVAVTVLARVVTPDLSYAARRGDEAIWVVALVP